MIPKTRKPPEECNSIDGSIRVVPFYVLAIGEIFNHKGMSYKKINEDAAYAGGKTQTFWPQDSVHLKKPLRHSEALEKYPALQRMVYS